MLKIYKVSKGSAIDFAAEELKKYLRMMMPEENDIDVDYNPLATDGFRLGLFCDLGVDGEVEDEKFDDYLYAECDERGGVIAGINARSVLLSVYEYLRHNGLRWLYPGPDGEYVPVKEINAVSFKIKPSCRYRGFANTTAASYQTNLEFIDFLPKIGMNTFMVEFRVPVFYTDNYYDHKRNEKNRAPERPTHTTILQWKRGTECEAAKRGLVFHDVGHGFCIDPFGIDSCHAWYNTSEKEIPDGVRKYLAEINGKRGFFHGVPINTNFCMSNAEARGIVADYVANYCKNHKNADAVHVWLADAANNHCECAECRKKTTSDWYIDLMNDIDEVMTERRIDTKIVFIAYVDTCWAPTETKLKNQDRFIFLLAPFGASCLSIPTGEIPKTTTKYERNNIHMAKTIGEYLGYYNDWREGFKGPALTFQYLFFWCEYSDLSRLKHSKTIHDIICLYHKMGIIGDIEDGDMRGFLPNGLTYYTLGRTLFDTSLSAEEIAEDYFKHAYGKDYKEFIDFFKKLEEVIPYAYILGKLSANPKVSGYYNPEISKKITAELPGVLALGKELVKSHYNSEIRVETVSARLLEHYLELCEWTGRLIERKAVGDDEGAKAIYNEFEEYFGKRECEIERYYNHCFYFNYMHYIVFDCTSDMEFVLQ